MSGYFSAGGYQHQGEDLQTAINLMQTIYHYTVVALIGHSMGGINYIFFR